MNNLIFNGKSTDEFGIYIFAGGTWLSPERDVSYIEVPGRNGDLSIDNGRFKNVEIVYRAIVMDDFEEKFGAFRAFLLSDSGYHRLEDTEHPDEYRLAEFVGPIEPTVRTYGAAKFDIKFNCKPQRYLKSGEKVTAETTFEANGSIHNSTLYAAKPLLRVYGTGSFGIGSETITITSANEYTDIDCDIKDAFKGTTNCNGNIQLASGDFPVLRSGNTGVSLNGVTKIEITPRWYTI